MRTKYLLRNLFFALSLGVALLISGSVSSFGQDDDGQRRGDRRARRQQDDSDHKSRRQQDDSDRKSRRQQDHSNRKSERQQERSDWNSRDQQRRSDWESRRQQRQTDGESRRRQVFSDWNSRRRQEMSDRESRRQQHSSDRQSRRQQVWGDWRGRSRGDDDDGDRRSRDRRDSDRRVRVYRAPAQTIWGNIFNGGQNFPRYYDNNGGGEQRFYNQQRRARRNLEKEQRRYARSYNRSFGSDYYDNNFNYSNNDGFNSGSGWKQQILRLVIGNNIGNRLGGGEYVNAGQYAPIYSNQPYNNPGRYMTAPQYGQYYSEPNAYQPDFGSGGGLFGGNSVAGGLLGGLPIAELIEQYTGGGFASELIGNVLAQGYDQGYIAGQTARQNGYGDAYYQNPYPYEGGIPYSVSVGENRRCLSEGYQIGYQDALNGQTGYDPQSDGSVDLVSLLVSNVLDNV